MGIGFEAHRDNVRLALNGYYPLSTWRDIGNSKLYALRPARGFSFTAQTYLPSAPQFGAKLSAERYFDPNIQLFSQEQSRSALKIGLNYTPIPLLKAGYDYRIGRGGGNKRHEIQLMLSYRFGIPMAHQLDSTRVRQFNALAGSWLDPVMRNHQVVLARKDSVRLSQFLRLSSALYQSLIDPNVALSEAMWQAIDALPDNVKVKLINSAMDIMIMGQWDNNSAELVPYLISQLLPDDCSLRIVDGQGFTRVHYNDARAREVTVELKDGHYRAIV